ncbi:hypothetical protein AC578_70 [Pseudocercospora eumusae]|uniref:Uncharacterized protein n=1 Tax=Pseudocercospora eumusae TaxID=321146 RepID=A0A139HNZ4_9PEZI|nr:hypothetical protein AC578_70 [Pseudocercospora eumusae]
MASTADSPTLGSEIPDRKTQQQPRPKPAVPTTVTNFSRPRIYNAYRDGHSNVKSVNAYYEDDTEADNASIHQDRITGEPMPFEPRFSLDEEEEHEEPLPREPRLSSSSAQPPPPSPSTSNPQPQPPPDTKPTSLLSRTEAFLKHRTIDPKKQAKISPPPPHPSNNNNTSSSSETTKNFFPPSQSILKQTCVEITSEEGEDTASHHTVSEDGDGDGKWHSSDYDTSGLSEKEKRRKGVNAALYAEMKAARGRGRGKGRVGVLMGNSYVS